jgi:hypothetical protein
VLSHSVVESALPLELERSQSRRGLAWALPLPPRSSYLLHACLTSPALPEQTLLPRSSIDLWTGQVIRPVHVNRCGLLPHSLVRASACPPLQGPIRERSSLDVEPLSNGTTGVRLSGGCNSHTSTISRAFSTRTNDHWVIGDSDPVVTARCSYGTAGGLLGYRGATGSVAAISVENASPLSVNIARC